MYIQIFAKSKVMLNIYKTTAMKKINKDLEEHNPCFNQHGIHLFKHMLFCGGTGLGKSNAVINLILTMQGCFNQIFIYTADPNEPLYVMLQQKLKDKLTIDSIEKIPPLSELKTIGQSLLIVDDFITQGKRVMSILEEYAIRSRKNQFTCCFLTQSFYACPIKIRQQIRYLVLLKLCDKRNFGMILSTIDTEIPAEIIRQIIKNATQEELNICMIDLQTRDLNKTFKRNFGLDYYILQNNGQLVHPNLFSGSGIIN